MSKQIKTDKKFKKLEKEIKEVAEERSKLTKRINVLRRINTALPKKKRLKFDAMIDDLTPKLLMANFNFNQKLKALGKKLDERNKEAVS